MSFSRRNLAFFRLAVLSNLEYRLNAFVDILVQPAITALIELTLWTALFLNRETLGGFGKESYLAYALWGAFLARISVNWMYEFRMMQEIESGSVSSVLVRPMSFFEYYLFQLLGYKLMSSCISLVFPIAACYFFKLPMLIERLPVMLLLVTFYLVLVQLLSFITATLAFHLNKTHSFTMAKNLGIWLLSGELIPLDLFPKFFASILILLPFSAGVYVPVGYITGRVEFDIVLQSFASIAVSIVICSLIAWRMWHWGLSKYVGTGA
jgi:ABC-2 type transport system permease protein